MKSFVVEVRVVAGTLLVGGHATTPAGVHAVQAQRKGVAYLPATALRGALREAAERVLLAAEQPACLGGTGLDSDAEDSTPIKCELGTAGQPCLACQLFGTPADDLAGRSRSGRLVLGDAQPIGSAPLRDRPGVGIDRAHRTAAEGILYNFRGTSPGDALTFRADGLLDEADGGPLGRLLRAAIRVTEHIGRGTSRGLGRVELRLSEAPAAPAKRLTVPTSGSAVRLVVKLASPTAIGEALPRSNERDTRMEIPGAALRGAVIFSAHAARPDASEGLDHLVKKAVFDTLHIDACQLEPREDILPAPWPLTMHVCKTHGNAHGFADDLLDRLTFRVAECESTLPGPLPEGCRLCPSALTRSKGSRSGGEPKTRLLTRVALDRELHGARDGALFSQVVLEEGTVFAGTIRNLTPEAIELVRVAFEHGVSVGQGRSSGRGCLEVLDLHAPPQLPTLSDRARTFVGAWTTHRQTRGITHLTRGLHLLPVTLLSPLLVPEGSDGAALLATALGLAESACLLKVRRFGIERGWNMEPGAPDRGPRAPTRTVEGGGVFVFELPAPLDAQRIERLESLEARGIGERTTSGFGRVLFFDPIHLRRQS